MSGECYSTNNLLMETSSSRKENINQGIKASDQSNVKINQLLEYETVVTSAESKCSQLKGQLERIKQLYNNQSEAAKFSIKKNETGARNVRTKYGSYVEPITTKDSQHNMKMSKMVRQNSRFIGTDNTGASLGTINNILSGITKSIQMPQLIDQVKSYDSKLIKPSEPEKSQEQIHGVEEIKINSKSKQLVTVKSKSKVKPRTSKSKVTTKTSSTIFKKAVKKSAIKINEKRNRGSDNQLGNRPGIPSINKRSRKIAARSGYTSKSYSRRSTGNRDLVEIYHNDAVKECKSSESDVAKKRLPQKETEKTCTEKTCTDLELIPPLKIEDNDNKTEVPTNKEVVSYEFRNYAMPTISSRMKRVAKYYMNSFNIKTIPFCPATSTTASHNIGINIQQVMNMVKTKQPVAKLSPTLAYNIGLAAGKWEDNPLSILVSTATSRTMYTNCPLSKCSINYQHLQEIAKTIPQETIEEVEENEETNSPDTQSMIITGPSGDVKVTNRKQTVWSAPTDDKKCTCVPQKGLEFQQIVNKFNGSVSKSKLNKTPVVQIKPKSVQTNTIAECLKPSVECIPLHNKEKKLKEVLGKLHDEFEKMTKTYDDLVKKIESGNADPESNKQLENLDKDLNSKEEEIVMVMSLYKEVLALKQQVKALKDRTSKENVSIKACQLPKFNGYNNTTTAGLLNKLLQRIQHFQTHYKRN